jgi:hypothetical protein
MIAKGNKNEEYRELKTYWITRLSATPAVHFFEFCPDVDFRPFNVIRFTNGYGKTAPTMDVECKGISIGTGKHEWGATGESFIISLGKVLSISNYTTTSHE